MSKSDPAEVPEAMWGVWVQLAVGPPLRVAEMVDGSPTDPSGVQPGDFIETVDRRPAASDAELIGIHKTKQSGATLHASLERYGSSLQRACVLLHRPHRKPPRKATRARGSRDNSVEPS